MTGPIGAVSNRQGVHPVPAAIWDTRGQSPAVRGRPCGVPGMELPDGVREHLLAAGANEEEIDRVMDNDALFTLAGDVVRRRDIEWMPIEDVAATAGVSIEEVERYRLLIGLPARDNLVPEWTIYGLESYRVAASLIGDEVTRAWFRVLAASAATVAAAATAMALNDATPQLREMELPPVDTLQLLDAMVKEMITRTPREWNHVFRQHLLLSSASWPRGARGRTISHRNCVRRPHRLDAMGRADSPHPPLCGAIEVRGRGLVIGFGPGSPVGQTDRRRGHAGGHRSWARCRNGRRHLRHGRGRPRSTACAWSRRLRAGLRTGR